MNDSFRAVRLTLPQFLLPACVIVLFLTGAFSNPLLAGSDTPANIDNALRRFLTTEEQGQSANPLANAAAAKRPKRTQHSAVRDADRRVLVDIHLNGKVPLATMRDQLTAAGGKVIAEDSSYRQGVLSAFLPPDKIVEIARSPGVLSLTLTRRPRKSVGATTSGGVFVLHTDMLNAQGLDGTGQTIGALSDSYDTAQTDLFGDPLTIHAAQDVASGDLPGAGNANNPNPVVVIEDFNPGPDDPPSSDEGRAMLQIVHDVAPKAKLAFATAFVSKEDFAANIRKLRTDANCNVIVDDIIYTEEPMFSDGIIAQAVDDVVNSSILAGPKCAYFSSASNFQGGGYVSTFTPITDAAARAGLPNQNLKLNQVPMALTTGGFHDFNTDPAKPADISQRFRLLAGTTAEFDFQWNDPFDVPGGVTTDYNVLVFDADGNYLADVSGTDDNFMNEEAIEDIEVENATDNDADYQIVISRAGTSPATPVANKIRYLALDDFGGIGAEEHYQPKASATHGHNCAKGAISTAAYVYDDDPSSPVGPPFTPFIEDFSSQGGPATIDFDASGNRLAVSEIRMKPDIAAPDGVNTTFFGDDYEGDGFPNFFGTSAAAPHAAGVAALLLQKAGGPGSLTGAQLKNILQSTVSMKHDLDPFLSQAVSHPARPTFRTGGTVTVTACGNSTNASSRDTNFFTVTFDTPKRRETLKSLTINLTQADLKFDTTSATGFPLTLGRLVNISPNNIVITAPVERETLTSMTLTFLHGAFTPSTSVSFGIDRDFIGDGGGNTADYLEAGTISAETTKLSLRGVFMNTYGFGFSIADGFGLIDPVKAAQQISP